MSDSQYSRYRDNFDKAFSSPNQANYKITAPSGSSNESAKKTNNAAPLPIPKPEPEQRTEPTQTPKKKCRRPNPWLEFAVQSLLCLFTLGAFVAAAVYAWISSGQLAALRVANEHAHDSLIAANRAYLSVGKIKEEVTKVIRIHIDNFGKVPAIVKDGNFIYFRNLSDGAQPPRITLVDSRTISQVTIPKDAPIYPSPATSFV